MSKQDDADSQLSATHDLLERHAGVWIGRYTHLNASFQPVDEHEFRIEAETAREGPWRYRQTSHYKWPSGETKNFVFEASYDETGGKLVWDNGRINGALWAIDDETLYLKFSYAVDDALSIHEMMQLSACGDHRARTWHWIRAGRIERITLVNERRA